MKIYPANFNISNHVFVQVNYESISFTAEYAWIGAKGSLKNGWSFVSSGRIIERTDHAWGGPDPNEDVNGIACADTFYGYIYDYNCSKPLECICEKILS